MCPGMLPATGWMAQVTFAPSASSPSAISRSACRACATAMPQPGTMMTETAFFLDHTATPNHADRRVMLPVRDGRGDR